MRVSIVSSFVERVRVLFRVGAVRALVYASLVVLAGHIVVILLRIRPSETILPLHYNIFFGIDLVGYWWQFFLFPAASTALFLGACVVASLFPRRPITQSILLGYTLSTLVVLFASTVLVLSQVL